MYVVVLSPSVYLHLKVFVVSYIYHYITSGDSGCLVPGSLVKGKNNNDTATCVLQVNLE